MNSDTDLRPMAGQRTVSVTFTETRTYQVEFPIEVDAFDDFDTRHGLGTSESNLRFYLENGIYQYWEGAELVDTDREIETAVWK